MWKSRAASRLIVEPVAVLLGPHVDHDGGRGDVAQKFVQLRVVALKNAVAVSEGMVPGKHPIALASVAHFPKP